MDEARRIIPRGIDPGFIYLEGGNPLLDAGEDVGAPHTDSG